MTAHAGHQGASAAPSGGEGTLAVPIDRVFCPCCEDDLDAVIRRFPHVTGVHVDAERMVAHVTVHRGMTTADEIARGIAACNYANPVPLPQMSSVASSPSMSPTLASTAVGRLCLVMTTRSLRRATSSTRRLRSVFTSDSGRLFIVTS
jgi:hypothetical protein